MVQVVCVCIHVLIREVAEGVYIYSSCMHFHLATLLHLSLEKLCRAGADLLMQFKTEILPQMSCA